MTAAADARAGMLVPAHLVDDSGAAQPRLAGGRCAQCDVTAFPPPDQCPRCLAAPLEPQPLSATGVLYSYSVVHVGPSGRDVPYTIGYIDLPGNVRVFGHVDEVDEARLNPDLPVRVKLEKVAGDAYRAVWIAREREAGHA